VPQNLVSKEISIKVDFDLSPIELQVKPVTVQL
jgi:hypothetical protein